MRQTRHIDIDPEASRGVPLDAQVAPAVMITLTQDEHKAWIADMKAPRRPSGAMREAQARYKAQIRKAAAPAAKQCTKVHYTPLPEATIMEITETFRAPSGRLSASELRRWKKYLDLLRCHAPEKVAWFLAMRWQERWLPQVEVKG